MPLLPLQVLDVHKNMLSSLPSAIGKLTALQKLDVSENRLAELPISVCELQEDLQLAIGRNPLERPSVEQARQGIGVIRRYFNYTGKKHDPAAASANPDPVVAAMNESLPEDKWKHRPVREVDGATRHDWAVPGGTALLFNCHNCPFGVPEGSDMASLLQEENVRLIATFNMQCIGRLRPSGSSLADSVEFFNEWLPWSSQAFLPGDAPVLVIEARARRKSATLIATPWLSFGCAIGARLNMKGSFYTVVSLRDDDMCQIVQDNSSDVTRQEFIDPTPYTVSRAASYSYKKGQKLMLLQGGRFVDATVDSWLGLRFGSRHRVGLTTKGRAKEVPGSLRRRNSIQTNAIELPDSFRRRNSIQANVMEVDLNEVNHAKLLFSTVAKYETSRNSYLEALTATHATVRDESTGQSISTIDQRVHLRPYAAHAAADEVAGTSSLNFLSLLEQILSSPVEATTTAPCPLLIRTHSSVEHELLQVQALHVLARVVQDDASSTHHTHYVPMVLPMARMVEAMQDEAKRSHPRDMMANAFGVDYPMSMEMLRQAMELRSLIILADVRNEAELSLVKEALLDEMLANRLLVIAPHEVLENTTIELPASFYEQCLAFDVDSFGLFLSDASLSDSEVRDLTQQMLLAAGGRSSSPHYERVVALHLSTTRIGGGAAQGIAQLLEAEACALRSLDVSFTEIDVTLLLQALAKNTSLTSLDVRRVRKVQEHYEGLGDLLLEAESKSHLCFFRCDTFDLLEGETSLRLRERTLDRGTVRLIAGLLKNNDTLQELDLGATDIEGEWVDTLLEVISGKASLVALQLQYNPAVNGQWRRSLIAGATERHINVALHF